MKFQQKQQPGPEHRGGCQRANTHTKLMAFRLLSGEAVGCEAEIGKLGKKDWSKNRYDNSRTLVKCQTWKIVRIALLSFL